MQISNKRTRPFVRGLACLLAAVTVLAACSFERRAGNPVERRATYFSYLAGEDIRKSCWSGADDRYRLVYNANFTNHVRTYEITGLHEAAGGVLDVEVFSPQHDPVLNIRLPLWPWQGQRAITPLDGDDMVAIHAALKLSGAFAKPQTGLKLDSASYYWLMTGCVGGQFWFNGFAWPSDAFAGLAFPDILARYDRSGVPMIEPAPGDGPLHGSLDRPAVAQNEPEDQMRFVTTFGRRGISIGAK